jgi:predicted nuclease of predicted toxin-antitoxin system
MTRYLVDENVNQKAVRRIPINAKGFDVLYPEAGGFKNETDAWVRRLANNQKRVLVTCDRDFSTSGIRLAQVPNGVLWLRPSRTGQRRIGDMFERFCKFLGDHYPASPYDFAGKLFEIYEDRVVIWTTDSAFTTYKYL